MKANRFGSKIQIGALSVLVLLAQGMGGSPARADESLALKLKNPTPAILVSEKDAESLQSTLAQALTLTERMNAGLTQSILSSRAPYYLEDSSLAICMESSDANVSREEILTALDSPTHCNDQGLCVKKIPR